MQIKTSLASRLIACALLGLGLNLITSSNLAAGTFQSDFNSGVPPAGMTINGSASAYDHSTGGKTGGALKLTDNTGSQQSSAIIDDFDSGATIGGFDVNFQVYIGGGTGADGMSFVFGDFADGTWGEDGPGSIRGLTIAFDVYDNNADGTLYEAPAIDVKWNNVTLFHRRVGANAATTPANPIGTLTTIRTQTTSGGAPVYVPVNIHVDTSGALSLSFSNVVVITNLPVFRPFMTDVDPPTIGPAYRFGFGARTGGSADNHWIDDLTITTFPLAANSGQPGLTLLAPQPSDGFNAGAASGVEAVFTNSTYSIDTATVTMRYGANTVTPAITEIDGNTRIAYRGTGGVLPTGRTTNTISYTTTSTPPFSNSFSFVFVVDPASTLPANYPIASVDTTKPGFKYRVHQLDATTFIRSYAEDPNRTLAVERQLALWYVDPATGQPYPNVADLSTAPADGYFTESEFINWQAQGTAAGFFSANSAPPRPDKFIGGIPGTTASSDYAAIEIFGYMFLTAGGHRFGFNSDDGFRVSFGPGTDTPSAFFAGNFDGGRGSGTATLFDVVIGQDGYYPVRITFWQGGGGFDAEFFYVDPATGQRVLVNDPENLAAPRVFSESAVSRPYISRVLPVQNWIGVSPDEDVVIDITDGGIPLDSSKVALFINNTLQTAPPSKNGKVTTIRRASSLSDLLPSGLNTVRLEYGYTEGGNAVTRTNQYSFTVAPYYTPIPVANKVTTGVVTSETGFHAVVAQIDRTRTDSITAGSGNGARISGGGDANRMPIPEVQLIQGNINPTNGLPYPNLADPGANNFNYDFDVVNWTYNAGSAASPVPVVGQSGWIRSDRPLAPLLGSTPDVGVPGFPGSGSSYYGVENGILEITTYLELKRGVTIFAFNSDDGFIAISAPDVHDTLGTLVGFFSGGRGNSGLPVAPVGQNPPVITPNVASGSTQFSVIVTEDGIYPFRILYWQGGTGFNAEFFSINKTNNTVALVGDTANGGIPAYRTYNGPARPWVKFSVCPGQWDNAFQQVGPGPINLVGRTAANISAADNYNIGSTTAYFARPWADVAIGGVIANGTSEANLRLLLNGIDVPATMSTNGTDVTVSYKPEPPLPSGTTNIASLVYAGTTNSWKFTVQSYTNLNAADALPLTSADPDSRGFKVKMTQIATIPAGYTQSSVARAEAQLAGIIGPDVAFPGPGPQGTHIYPGIINWNNNVQTNVTGASGVPIGNFQTNVYGAATGWRFPFYVDEPLPGVPGTGRSNVDNSAAEVFAYLEFPTSGYYRLGVNSDDAFGMKVGTPGVTNGTVIASIDLGKGSSDIPISFIVPQPGLYPIRLIYYNGGGGANLEFFSYTETGGKIPINDPNNPAAIKAYYDVASGTRPNITSATVTGGTITIIWVNGGTLESTTDLTNGPWTSTGDSDGSFSEPVTAGIKFYRVKQ